MKQMNHVERLLHENKTAHHIEDVAELAGLTYHQSSCCLKRLHAAGRAKRIGSGIYAYPGYGSEMLNRFLSSPAGHRLS